MNSHKHARLTASGRALLCQRVLQQGWKALSASEAAGVSLRTAYKWLARFRTEGPAGLADRSSRPRRCPHAISIEQHQQFEQLRRQRWPLWRIARHSGCSLATISRCMKRLGLSRLSALQPPVPVVRYERQTPGELLHIDTKRLGRIQGVGHRITGDRTLNRNKGTPASFGALCLALFGRNASGENSVNRPWLWRDGGVGNLGCSIAVGLPAGV